MKENIPLDSNSDLFLYLILKGERNRYQWQSSISASPLPILQYI